ncbi:MAG TPA: EF-hand domain-containing protein [Acidobacteriaceae bacterium]
MPAVFLLALSGSLSGWAQGAQQQPRMVLDALDLDHDGKLSAAEIKAAPASLLKLDRNGDGQLTADELSPRPENTGAAPDELVTQLMGFDNGAKGYLVPGDVPDRMQGLFRRADANHDGKLTADEIRGLSTHQVMPVGIAPTPGRAAGAFRLDPLLNALDSNHDGAISAAEIAVATDSLLTLDKNANGEITADEMRVRQQTPEERADHMLDEWDTNKDGRIARAEAPDRMAAQFNSFDANGDGFLDRDELIAYFKTQGNQPRGGAPRGAGAPSATPKN